MKVWVFFAYALALAVLLSDAESAAKTRSVFKHKYPDRFRITLRIVTYNRPHSLQRLLDSVAAAEYYGDTVDIFFCLDQSNTDKFGESLNVIDSFSWKYGAKQVFARTVNAGLATSIIECWYPSHNDEFAIYLEDDITVAADYYRWAKTAVGEYYYGKNRDPNIYGVSIYNPHWHKPTYAKMGPYRVENGDQPYLFQAVESWGQLLFPDVWKEFRLWHPQAQSVEEPHWVPHALSTFFGDAWTKWLTRFIYEKGYYIVEPNLPGDLSWSKNHLEPGTHYHEGGISESMKKEAHCELVVESKESYFSTPPREQMVLLDIRGEEVTPDQLKEKAAKFADSHEHFSKAKELVQNSKSAFDFKKASKLFTKAADMVDGHFLAHHYLGIMAMQDGNKKEAIKQFERVLEIFPHFDDAKAMLKQLRQ